MAVKKIEAGELKRTIVFKQPTSVRNSQGEKITTYEETITCRAKIEETNYRIQGIAPALLHTDTVHIRFSEERSGITKDWLVAYDNEDHVIHSIDRTGIERNSFLKFIVKAKGG